MKARIFFINIMPYIAHTNRGPPQIDCYNNVLTVNDFARSSASASNSRSSAATKKTVAFSKFLSAIALQPVKHHSK